MVDVNTQHCFYRLQFDFNFALQITKKYINNIMRKRHPYTAEEVIHLFKLKKKREKQSNIYQQTRQIN